MECIFFILLPTIEKNVTERSDDVMYQCTSQVPFWIKQTGAQTKYQWLDGDIACDVLVVGAGVAGALAALKLAQTGANTVLLAEGPVGYGGTACAEGTVTYQLGGGLSALAGKTNMNQAVNIFRKCSETIDAIELLCSEHADRAGFTRRDCFYFTDNDKNVDTINEEYLARRHNGFTVERVDRQAAMEMFSFPVACGIYTPGQGAELDPYLFTQGIAEAVVKAGGTVYENTPVCEINAGPNDVKVMVGTGREITAQKVVLATGTANHKICAGEKSNRTAFTIVTKPVAGFDGWQNQALLCGDGSPQVRLRTTPDRRIMISGLDCGLLGDGKLAGVLPVPQFVQKKYQELNGILMGMFPGIRGLEAEYYYTSDYVSTSDGLPIIGVSPHSPHIYLDLCTGDNGLAFAVIAADLLAGLYQGHPDPDIAFYSPDR